MTGLLSNYLGQGLLADRPAVPEVFTGSLALYRDESGNVSAWDEEAEVWVNLIPEPEPFPDLSGFISEAPDDAFLYVRGQKTWVILPAYPEMPDVPVQEAPADGNQYVRKNSAWEAFELPPIPDAGIPEAPDDGKLYGRKSQGWVEVVVSGGGGGGIPEAPNDGKKYARASQAWTALPDEVKGPIKPHKYWRFRGTRRTGPYDMLAEIQWLDDQGNVIPNVGSSPDASRVFDLDPGSVDQVGIATYNFTTPVGVAGITNRGNPDVSWEDRNPIDFAIDYSDDGAAWSQSWAVVQTTNIPKGELRTFINPNPERLPLVVYTEEAPKDGKQYVRKDGAWSEIAPGKILYSWQQTVQGNLPVQVIPVDVSAYDEILIMIDRVTKASSSSIHIGFSVNNNVSIDSAANYLTDLSTGGSLGFIDQALYSNGGTAGAVTFSWRVSNLRSANSPKPFVGSRNGLYVNYAAVTHLGLFIDSIYNGGRITVVGVK